MNRPRAEMWHEYYIVFVCFCLVLYHYFCVVVSLVEISTKCVPDRFDDSVHVGCFSACF